MSASTLLSTVRARKRQDTCQVQPNTDEAEGPGSKFASLCRLLNQDINFDPRTKEASEELCWAALEGELPFFKALVHCGVDINSVGVNGAIPFLEAIKGAMSRRTSHGPCVAMQIVNWMLSNGVDVRRRFSREDTALHIAMRDGFPELTRRLLDAGVALFAVNDRGETALHNHCEAINNSYRYDENIAQALARHIEITHMLLEAGLDANAKTHCGRTPLHMISACRDQMWESPSSPTIIKILVAHGADQYVEDALGRTSLWYAWAHDCRRLEQHGCISNEQQLLRELTSEFWTIMLAMQGE